MSYNIEYFELLGIKDFSLPFNLIEKYFSGDITYNKDYSITIDLCEDGYFKGYIKDDIFHGVDFYCRAERSGYCFFTLE